MEPGTSLWSPDSWRTKPDTQPIPYEDRDAVEKVAKMLRSLPPLVTSWEVERLKLQIAEAQVGTRFLLQGGDCAETFGDCRPGVIANRLKILLQMSLVLIHGGKQAVVRVGRFAGQYAKPRSSPTEIRDGVEHPSYFGDLVNKPEFSAEARRADPNLLLSGYQHAALTLNFVRSLSEGGFADLHHPEYWDLSFFERADLSPRLRSEYQKSIDQIGEAIRFMQALSPSSTGELSRVEFFTSHEGLNLEYESAQTRTVPHAKGYYCLTTHMPWIGERTRSLDGCHLEFFRGIQNPVGVKLGPKANGEDLLRLLDVLNPTNEPGKIVLITRMGADNVSAGVTKLSHYVRKSGHRVLWVCDPMHGNTRVTASGIKTRVFDDILRETEETFDALEEAGSRLGGVHIELTGEDVTECIGGGVTEDDLDKNYVSLCDPRLNYRQSLEMVFRIAKRMAAHASVPPAESPAPPSSW